MKKWYEKSSAFLIHVARTPNGWWANLDDYDGAPDASPADRVQGHGMSHRDAILDLLEQRDELDDKKSASSIRKG